MKENCKYCEEDVACAGSGFTMIKASKMLEIFLDELERLKSEIKAEVKQELAQDKARGVRH